MTDKKVEVEISAKATGFEAEFAKITSGAKSAADKINSSFSGLKGALAGLGIAFSGAAIVAWGRDLVEAAGRLADLSESTGSTVEELSKLQNIARVNGTSFDTFAQAIERLAAGMGGTEDETNKAAAAMKFLGVTARDPAQALTEIALKLDKYADGVGKAGIARDLFGKSGVAFLSTLKQIANSQDVLNTVTTDQAAKAKKLAEEFVKLELHATDLKNAFLNDVVPALSKLVTEMDEGRKIAGGFFQALLLFGTINPFNSTSENIATLRKQIDDLTKDKEGDAGFSKFINNLFGKSFDKAINDATKKLEFVKFQQRQFALSLISESNLDARDYQARFKPSLPNRPGKDGGGKAGVDEFGKAIERVGKLAAEADLELAAMFSTQEITAAQKALAQLTASEEWKKFTQPQKDQLTAKFNAVDAIERETLAWKAKRKAIEDEIKVLKEHEEAQRHAAEAFTQALGAYADQNSIIERQIELVGKDDLAHQEFIETLEKEKLINQAVASGGEAYITTIEQQFQKRIALINQLSDATKRFQQIQELNSIFTNSFADGLVEIVNGTKSVKDAFKDMERAIVDGIARIAAQNLANSLFGVSSTGGGGIGEWILNIGKLFAGGGGFGAGSIGLGGFATGTNFAPGGMALVGERGPELVNLPRGAQVIPNDVLTARRAERSVVVNNTFMVSGQTDTRSQRQIAGAASNAVLAAMRDR